MGDLSCQPPAYYTPYSEPLVCQAPAPEELVCKAPEPVSAPAKAQPKLKAKAPTQLESVSRARPSSDQLQSISAAGTSAASMPFLDFEQQICIDPSLNPLAASLQQASSAHIPASRFNATLDNSQFLAELELEARDLDGFQQRSQHDIQGTIHQGRVSLNQSLLLPALKAMEYTHSHDPSTNTTTEIRGISFDAREQAYVVQLKATKSFEIPYFFDPKIWDHFELRFQVNAQGKLEAKVQDNWLPNGRILEQVEARIQQTLKQKLPAEAQVLSFEMQQHKNKLTLTPQLQNLEIPLAEQGSLRIDKIASEQARLEIDKQGHLHLNLRDVAFTGSSSQHQPVARQSSQPDQIRLQAKLALGQDQQRQVHAQGQVSVVLDETETAQIRLGHDALSDYLKSGTLQSDFSLYLQQSPGHLPRLESHNQVQILQADLGAAQKVDLQTRLKVNFDPQQGIQLETPGFDYPPLALNTSPGGLELLVNGSEYYPEMKRMISAARESIALETFMYTEDAVGRELAYLLARKAAGLEAEGPARLSGTSPQGVDIRFIFNSWKGNQADGQASAHMLQEAMGLVAEDLKSSSLSPAEQAAALAQMNQNLDWHFFTEGILRSDHRKVLVVDGSQATVGGMNLGQNYLGEAGYHDVMLKLAGPEVRQVHAAFLRNWAEFNQTAPELDKLKSESELLSELGRLQAGGAYRQQAQVQTLLTDDQQVDIERGLVKLIDEAQSEINIQQAFFSSQTINRHLAAAMERGVTINLIVAEEPLAASVFSAANLLSAHQLAQVKQRGAPGDIRLHYYHHEAGGKQAQIHTKAITVDGQRALVGSANMIGRSLGSPFLQVDAAGQVSQAMYNKELSLWIENPDFVHELNQRLFQQDMQHQSRELDAAAIEAEVHKAGGEAELRKQALAAPFT